MDETSKTTAEPFYLVVAGILALSAAGELAFHALRHRPMHLLDFGVVGLLTAVTARCLICYFQKRA